MVYIFCIGELGGLVLLILFFFEFVNESLFIIKGLGVK